MRFVSGFFVVLVSPILSPILFLYTVISIIRNDIISENESSIWAWYPIFYNRKIFWLRRVIRTPKKDRSLLSLRHYTYKGVTR